MAQNIDLNIASQVTNGGRSLKAIWKSKKLTTNQKITLQYLASELDFRGDFRESRWSAIRNICEATSISRTTQFEVLKKLEEMGYITREQRFEKKVQLPTSYAITDKIFEEFYELLSTQCASRTTSQCASRTTPVRQPDYPSAPAGHRTPLLAPLKNPSISFSAGAKKLKRPKSAVVSKKTPKAPQKAPPRAQKSAGVQTDRQATQKAVAALSLVYKPSDGEKRFWDVATIKECASVALERYGLETIIRLRDSAIRDKVCGHVPFDQMYVLDLLAKLKNSQ